MLITSRLNIPSVRTGFVPRSRLIASLDSGLEGRLILLSAPAGYGKTTVLAHWAHHLAEQGLPVGWLSLEPSDSDPASFIAYLVAALRNIAPSAGETTLSSLRANGAVQSGTVVAALANDLAAAAVAGLRGVLVMDDYHEVQSREVHEMVASLLDHMPPAFHMAIASREDPPLPLPRLRARAQLCELRAADLRFTAGEASMFLRGTMGLNISPDTVAALEKRTEGWIAGLQLAALSMRDQSDVQGFITSLTGTHRYILDYLIEEVLNRQPANVQTFLLHTCIADRLCASLCDALLAEGAPPEATSFTGSAGSTRSASPPGSSGSTGSQLALEQLERANLFLTPLDTERRWYRYHHLFADLLRARLKAVHPAMMLELHLRAARWYESRDLQAEAIEHALASEDFPYAARLISRGVAGLEQYPHNLGTLLRWVQALPRELVRSNARFSLDYGWILASAGRIKEADEYALLTQQLLTSNGSRAGAMATDMVGAMDGELASLQTLLAARQNDLDRVVSMAGRAIELLPEADLSKKAAILIFLADAYVQSDRWQSALETYTRAEALSTAAGNAFATMMSIQSAARLHMMLGNLGTAATLYRRASGIAGVEPSALLGMPSIGLGQVLAERGEFDEAKECLVKGIELLKAVRDWNTNLVQGYATLAGIQRLQGDTEGASATMQAATELADISGREHIRKPAEWMMVQHWLNNGELERAAGWAREAAQQGSRTPTHVTPLAPHYTEVQAIRLARVRLALGQVDSALEAADAACDTVVTSGLTGMLIEIRALQAVALSAKGQKTAAMRKLGEALSLAEREGHVLAFIEHGMPMQVLLQESARSGAGSAYADRLLSCFSALPQTSGRPAGAMLVEPLSEREMQVLALLVSGLSGPQIAGTMTVGINTVKTHLKSIYGKLGVHTRGQAVARARKLRLV